MDGLHVLSVPWLRKNAYRVFMTTHVLCVVVLLLAVSSLTQCTERHLTL